jgi:hypothetical protein
MSVNSLGIWCGVCHFRSSNSRIWGIYTYEFPDGERLSIERAAGWCYKCKDIEPIENLSIVNTEADGGGRNMIKNGKNGKASCRDMITSIFPFIGLRQKNKETSSDRAFQDTLAARNRFLSLRLDPAKCLACGETNIECVDIPTPPKGEMRPLPWPHPNCGGMLYVRNLDIRIHYIFRNRIYDIQGNYLRIAD